MLLLLLLLIEKLYKLHPFTLEDVPAKSVRNQRRNRFYCEVKGSASSDDNIMFHPSIGMHVVKLRDQEKQATKTIKLFMLFCSSL